MNKIIKLPMPLKLLNCPYSFIFAPNMSFIGLTYEWCLRNIVFASQMSHKNILMLIGCCLETQIPVLVFESVSSGILANYIHGPRPSHFEPFLLTHRLKIAMEIANALAYLHVGFPRPIVFKNIKLSSILFDEDHVAKLFDFSLAESIPDGETHIKDAIPIGIMGFVATEYVTTMRNATFSVLVCCCLCF